MAPPVRSLDTLDLYDSGNEPGLWLLLPAGAQVPQVPGLPASTSWTKRRSITLDGTPRIGTPPDTEIRAALARLGYCAFRTRIEFIDGAGR
jgi:hypothetical protein